MKPPPASTLVNRIILFLLALLVFSGSLGLGAVWMRQEISQAANQSRALHVKIEDIERRLDEVNAQVAAAVNPDTLLRQNETMRLALVAPRETQVVRVGESAELRLAAKRNREVFSVATASFEPSAARAPAFQFVTAALR
jgi:outer membrane murein-binding lipoprotein Lpp